MLQPINNYNEYILINFKIRDWAWWIIPVTPTTWEIENGKVVV
jgi:hypothetical protein